ncbi:hypothetical protein COO60DRAFT_1520151 [Scenedesmus sp. NREL 46B-D3]|nr:hypothetical protein COO60DRAFT_1520151 [Scenedesmus sp. NREL 46B-D3]
MCVCVCVWSHSVCWCCVMGLRVIRPLYGCMEQVMNWYVVAVSNVGWYWRAACLCVSAGKNQVVVLLCCCTADALSARQANALLRVPASTAWESACQPCVSPVLWSIACCVLAQRILACCCVRGSTNKAQSVNVWVLACVCMLAMACATAPPFLWAVGICVGWFLAGCIVGRVNRPALLLHAQYAKAGVCHVNNMLMACGAWGDGSRLTALSLIFRCCCTL